MILFHVGCIATKVFLPPKIVRVSFIVPTASGYKLGEISPHCHGQLFKAISVFHQLCTFLVIRTISIIENTSR